jgi:hypothetical protein
MRFARGKLAKPAQSPDSLHVTHIENALAGF